MSRLSSVLLVFFSFLLLFLAGCATLKVPTEGVYPFKASFEGTAFVKGEDMDFDGALSIVSRNQGLAEVYGPIGLPLYTVNVSGGQVTLYNMWGRAIKQFPFSHEQFMGILAGVPPDSRYIWKSSEDGITTITYVWGTLQLDRDELPLNLHVKSDPVIDVTFLRNDRKGTITLMMSRGSDKVKLLMDVVEGGRWRKGSYLHNEGG